MSMDFAGWNRVAKLLHQKAEQQGALREHAWLNQGQRASVRAIAKRIGDHGVLIADEVGMGKTRIAVTVARSVVMAGGRVAILVPPGLGYQWEEELRDGGITGVPPVIRSFRAYLAAWECEEILSQQPWFLKPVLLVSHNFTTRGLGAGGEPWRRALLPEVYARWRVKTGQRLPRYYHNNEALADDWVRHAARSIVDAIPCTGRHPARRLLDEIINSYEWHGSLEGDYHQGTKLRRWLEGVVGLGLGVFDLVIIDEAHKCRGSESGLSRLLQHIILPSRDARRLGMTATPVELDVGQWQNTLGRIGLAGPELKRLQAAITTYAEAVKRVRRCWRSSPEVRKEYEEAAETYSQALRPFVLRRDKREDEAVQLFTRYSGLPISHYRRESEISIELGDLTPEWQQAVCAVEALSFATRLADDAVGNRLRLTLGNGHGIAALLDRGQRSEDDSKQEKEDLKNEMFGGEQVADGEETEDTGKISTDPQQIKRRARSEWWQTVIVRAFGEGKAPLFDHPAILAAVRAIEDKVQKGEKVLVFGRYTRPMRALVELLNARAMLRALLEDRPWPQTKVHGGHQDADSEWPAVRAAHRQLGEPIPLDTLDVMLQRQYSRFDSRRQRFRDGLIERLSEGFGTLRPAVDQKCLSAFMAFSRTATQPGNEDLHLVQRALLELIDPAESGDTLDLAPEMLAQTFCELIKSASDRDDPDIDEDGDGVIDESDADNLWERLSSRLRTEYGRTQGGFARLMYGGTPPESRRLIQLAFNRPHSHLRVLVAQSLVGREGLNLHKACRIVVMLHPEWNPGVAEQQIGRVDRVECHWAKTLSRAIKHGEPLPRIEIWPVIFRGTYDEHNWMVLRERWDDLRAQLHGIVVPDRVDAVDDESRRILEEIAANAPTFTPRL